MDLQPSIRAPRESDARKFYLAYLSSPSWRVTRNHALRRAGYRCSQCQGGRDLQVHHKTYERLGREWDQDLEVLCETCHEGHHDVAKANDGSSSRIYLKLVGQEMHGKAITTLADVAEAVKVQCAKLKIPYDSECIGNAIALVAGKRKHGEPARDAAAIATSPEPLNKGEALRILFELSDKKPVIHSMPGARISSIDIYAPVYEPGADHDRY